MSIQILLNKVLAWILDSGTQDQAMQNQGRNTIFKKENY